MKIDGNKQVVDEVLSQIELWDAAIIGKKIEHLVDQCARDISMFDLSSQILGVDAYKEEWMKFSPYFNDYTQIVRRDMKIHATDELAVIHCHSKVENTLLKDQVRMPWCRTTLCMQKKNGQWLVVHQHISMPIDMMTGQVIILKDRPKLRLVI